MIIVSNHPPRQINFGPRLGTWRLFCGSFRPGMGWFRIFGIGVSWKDTTRHELIFSERYGHTRPLRVGAWRIGWLAPRLSAATVLAKARSALCRCSAYRVGRKRSAKSERGNG